MATNATRLPRLTPEEYLVAESAASERSEYFDGRIVAMAGGTRAHALIVTKLLRAIDTHLDGKSCTATANDLKVWIPKAKTYAYPDISVVCDPVESQDDRLDVVTNPILIVEVLSPSTEKRDRHTKFRAYKTIPSFKQYVLVSQEEPAVEVYTRTPEDFWVYSEAYGIESTVTLSSIDLTIPLSFIYDRVEFSA
jgi:Uma2 family endonuclease